ncbi:class I SAM-dependent methyltransferase [Clostridium oryzae]|uniref:Ribosomal RNA small subunit methyltransferase H n=1 Tax=Clostridium oryzae TaxID=1450648 RepID=A0A1V4I4F7_9CLOT|nr:class I SAM-dependent methyltransferase [Clostridium oryzae]OPJ54856.1 ribosomal RNA small subunit methyltransferase H [Clostridium oryzae]
MTFKILPKNAVELSKLLCRESIKTGDIVVDATMGNGNDTIFLCTLVGSSGKVFAFDIQEQAVKETKKRLEKNNFSNTAELILDSHSKMDKYVNNCKVKLVLFNLGYLPGGNHSVTTKVTSTIEALKAAINILDINGLIILVIYPGHEEGAKEKDALEQYVGQLDQKIYNVMRFSFMNQVNNPPLVISIEKLLE